MSVQVLLVDDDNGVLFLHELMITESNFSDNILAFNNAKTAMMFLEEHQQKESECVIFLDINMPGMTGWDFLEKLDKRDLSQNIHVVMVTSSVNRSDQITANKFTHVVDYIEKPLNLEICEKLKKNKYLKHIFTRNSN